MQTSRLRIIIRTNILLWLYTYNTLEHNKSCINIIQYIRQIKMLRLNVAVKRWPFVFCLKKNNHTIVIRLPLCQVFMIVNHWSFEYITQLTFIQSHKLSLTLTKVHLLPKAGLDANPRLESDSQSFSSYTTRTSPLTILAMFMPFRVSLVFAVFDKSES